MQYVFILERKARVMREELISITVSYFAPF